MIENEIKYVLVFTPDGVFDLEHGLIGQGHKFCFIYQGYLDGVRVRQTSRYDAHGNFCEYHLTYKRRLANGRNIEIEPPILAAEFQMLWNECETKLAKRRFEFVNLEENVTWYVDFFKADGHAYFVMAEAEMPEHQEAPTVLPQFIADNLLFTVPRDDDRFTAMKLADPVYATALYNEISGKS